MMVSKFTKRKVHPVIKPAVILDDSPSIPLEHSKKIEGDKSFQDILDIEIKKLQK